MTEIKLLHRQAMERTDLALEARRIGEADLALSYFSEAYKLEASAASLLANDLSAEPSRSVLLRSAASLALDCKRTDDAEKLICTALAGNPPAAIAEELRDLLEQVYFQRHLSLKGIILGEDEMQMSISGGAVGYGITTAKVFLDRVENTEKLLYRTAERHQRKPFREKGGPSKETLKNVELYLTIPRAASYAVTFKVGGEGQLSLPGMSLGGQIIDEMFESLELFTRDDVGKLKERITDEAYYQNFVALARNMSPDGQEVKLVGFTRTRNGQTKSVALETTRDKLAHQAIAAAQAVATPPTDGAVEVTGRLQFADSRTKGKDEIQIIDAGNVKHIVVVPPGMMSDIVKPLWDSYVTVTGIQKGKKIHLQDIRALDTDEPVDA